MRVEPTVRRGTPPRGEGGMLLILTMVLLLALSTLAASSLIGALLERGQSHSAGSAVLALSAAEAGIATGMAWLSDPENIDDYPADAQDVPNPRRIADAFGANTGWQAWSRSFSRTLPNGARYEATVRFARERENLNAAAGDTDCCDVPPEVPYDEQGGYQDGDANSCSDCPGDLVLYNAGSGDGGFAFPGAYFSGAAGDEGFPLLEIRSRGLVDDLELFRARAVREVVLYVARNNRPQVEGAFTTRGGVTVGANARVDGRDHDPAGGLPGACGLDLPGVTVDVAGSPPPCGGNIVSGPGVPCSTAFDPSAPGKRPLAATPWDVLGISEADFNSLFLKDTVSATIPRPCSAAPLYLWFAGESGIRFNNSSSCTAYRGILVVHNEHFDAAEWERRCPFDWDVPNADGGHQDQYDPAYCANPYYQPATLDMSGNVRWTGIVIADQVMLVTGSPGVSGAVVSLATPHDSPSFTVRSMLGGNIRIDYSCEAIEEVTGPVGYKRKLGWRRLR